MTDGAARIREAERVLREAGVRGTVTATGPGGDVAAVVAARDAWRRVRALAPRIRALGFRYVALDLAPGEPGSDAAGDGRKAARAVERT